MGEQKTVTESAHSPIDIPTRDAIVVGSPHGEDDLFELIPRLRSGDRVGVARYGFPDIEVSITKQWMDMERVDIHTNDERNYSIHTYYDAAENRDRWVVDVRGFPHGVIQQMKVLEKARMDPNDK